MTMRATAVYPALDTSSVPSGRQPSDTCATPGREAIGAEKAHIFRTGRAAVCADADPPGTVNFDQFNDPNSPNRTARQRLAAHATEAACAGCHKLTDPIGLAMEKFDGAGQLRENENGVAIDTTGELNGKPASIFTCVPGADVKEVDAAHCTTIGSVLAQMHLAGQSYIAMMPNPRGAAWWETVMPDVLPFLDAPAAEASATGEPRQVRVVALGTGQALDLARRGDAGEMRRPKTIFQPRGRRPGERYCRDKASRIHFRHRRRKNQIRLDLRQLRTISVKGARITGEILIGAKLSGVDEDCGDDTIGASFMPFTVKIAWPVAEAVPSLLARGVAHLRVELLDETPEEALDLGRAQRFLPERPREPVDPRRDHLAVAVAAEVAVAQIVGEDKNDVGFGSSRSFAAGLPSG